MVALGLQSAIPLPGARHLDFYGLLSPYDAKEQSKAGQSKRIRIADFESSAI